MRRKGDHETLKNSISRPSTVEVSINYSKSQTLETQINIKTLYFRIGDMGEFSFIKGIKSVEDGTPSFCVRGIKISEHLGPLLKQLKVDYGKKEAEMDVINISCDGDKVNIIFGECKVTNKFLG